MRIRTFLKPLSFLPAIALMYMIFVFSAQEASVSSELSREASRTVVKAVDMVFDMQMDDYHIDYFSGRIEGVTRKLAHMTEYFLLAIAVSFPLYVYGLHGILLVLLAGFFCVAFACSDEFHQSFVAGRSPEVRDVFIDSIGILIGIILVRIIGWTGRKTVFRPESKKEKAYRRDSRSSSIDDQIYYEEAPSLPQEKKPSRKPSARKGAPTGNPYPTGQQVPPACQQNPYRQDPYHQNPYGQNPYQQAPYSQNPYQQPYGQNPYQQPFGQNPYPTSPYQNDPYQQAPYQQNWYQPVDLPDQDSDSSDDLSDDMPFSHLFRPKH